MGHKKRGYKRDTPLGLVRDYKLFAIACEGGKREPDYFNVFQYLSRKIKVDVIENCVTDNEMFRKHEQNSAPKWVLDRAIRYIEKNDLKDEDDLWFVIDKDRWSDIQIRELATFCSEFPNWHLVVSNPCFEVWLFFHKKADIKASISVSCNDFKKEISSFEKGGYHPLKFIPDFQKAIVNAKANDSDVQHFMPKINETKVYQLGEAILAEVHNTDILEFINVTIPRLIKS
ncbi:MAG TPA: RloB family protein [Bacteroidales bacterium]|nr:RloB family protein [Bacteroidales bacterium]